MTDTLVMEITHMAKRHTATVLDIEMVNEDGSLTTVGAIVAEMQRDGFPQRFIDRWLQGLGRRLHDDGQRY